MSDLPTLYAHPWTLDHNLDANVPLSRAPINGHPNITYVPASRLDATTAALKASQDEVAALRAQLTNARKVIRKFANRFSDDSVERLVLNQVAGWDVFDAPAALTPKEPQ